MLVIYLIFVCTVVISFFFLPRFQSTLYDIISNLLFLKEKKLITPPNNGPSLATLSILFILSVISILYVSSLEDSLRNDEIFFILFVLNIVIMALIITCICNYLAPFLEKIHNLIINERCKIQCKENVYWRMEEEQWQLVLSEIDNPKNTNDSLHLDESICNPITPLTIRNKSRLITMQCGINSSGGYTTINKFQNARRSEFPLFGTITLFGLEIGL